MFRAARAALRFLKGDPAQIEFPLTPRPSLRERLLAAGLSPAWTVTTTDNRATMVSFRGESLRVHETYAGAPDHVIAAIARFVTSRRRSVRRDAGRLILEYAPRAAQSDAAPVRSRDRTHPDDERFVRPLQDAHAAYNADVFAGALRALPIRISRRMRRKLGHYSPAVDGLPAEIAISRSHIRRESWDAVLHTLLHEMVHQWQDENGHTLAHDARFRRMARSVGADPWAVRREGSVQLGDDLAGSVTRHNETATTSRAARSRTHRSTR